MRKESIVTSKDFDAFVPAGFIKTTESTSIASGTYSWNDALKAIHLNDGTTTLKSMFILPLGYAQRGDFIKLSSEFMSVNGVKPKIILGYNPATPLSQSVVLSTMQATITGQFEDMELEYLCEEDAYYFASFGLDTADIGEFYGKNFYATITTNYVNSRKYVQGFRTYVISNAGGTFAIQTNFADDLATLTVDSVAKEINLTHSKPFAAKAGIAFEGLNSAGISPNYDIRTQSHSLLGCKIKIYDKATNTLQDPATITGILWFQLLFVGLDNKNDFI